MDANLHYISLNSAVVGSVVGMILAAINLWVRLVCVPENTHVAISPLYVWSRKGEELKAHSATLFYGWNFLKPSDIFA